MNMQKLYEYQNLRCDYFKLKEKINCTVKKEELLEWKGKIEQINKDRGELETLIHEKNKFVEKNDSLIKDIDVKQKDMEKQLYEGNVVNPKELLSIQKKLDELGDNKKNAEGTSVEENEKISDLKKNLENKKQELMKEYKPYKSETNQYKQNKEIEKVNLNELARQVKEMEKEIDSDLLETYLKHTKSMGNIVLALVKKGRCENCNIDIPKVDLSDVRGGNKLVNCENCGRILAIL